MSQNVPAPGSSKDLEKDWPLFFWNGVTNVPIFMWDRLTIYVSEFEKAFHCFKTGKEAKTQKKEPEMEMLAQAAKPLFSFLFSAEEIKTQSITGKKRSDDPDDSDFEEGTKLDHYKLMAIDRLLGHLKHCWREGKTLEDSVPRGEDYKKDLGCVLTKRELKYVEKKVYIKYKNDLARKMGQEDM